MAITVEIECKNCSAVSPAFDATNEAAVSEWLSTHVGNEHPACPAYVTIGASTFHCPIDVEHTTHGGYMHSLAGTVHWRGNVNDSSARAVIDSLQYNGPMINRPASDNAD